MGRRLPPLLYELSAIGRSTLAGLNIGPIQRAEGLTRAGFLFEQMESAATLGLFEELAEAYPLRRNMTIWRKRLKTAKGFCYLKLFDPAWVFPALCTLGAYPAADDVARLSPYFREDRDDSKWGFYPSSHRGGQQVWHIQGMNRRSRSSIETKLKSHCHALVGASGSRPRAALPPQQSSFRDSDPRDRRDHPDHSPDHQRFDDKYRRLDDRPPARRDGRNRHPHDRRDTRDRRPDGDRGHPNGPRRNGRYFDPPAEGRNNYGNKRSVAPVSKFFQPYNAQDPKRRQGNGAISKVDAAWKSKPATHDDMNVLLDDLRAKLPDLPSSVSDPLWNDFLAWFQDASKEIGFNRDTEIPRVKEYFDSLYEPALASEKEREAHFDDLESKGKEVSKLVAHIAELELDLANPPPGKTIEGISAALSAAREKHLKLDAELDLMEAEAFPPSELGDPIADNSDFVPVDPAIEVRPWLEKNYERYDERINELYQAPTGKIPLESLFVKMAESVDSKILLPRPLELYTEAEINSAIPKNRAPWFNRHEDPLEPVKCWSPETFAKVYSKPGFHFMVARLSQLGAQTRDPKLPTLRSKLASRWSCHVEISSMDPRQDWMLCTIPDISGPRAEITSTAIMRLSEGNASYVVRHFGPLLRTRDLLFSVKGVNTSEESLYAQARKRLLEFEASGVNLGWRILGIRKTGAAFQYRASFILESPEVYWPWTMSFGHEHGSINPILPLLNFDPPWQARKPYACQVCYGSIHSTNECPLSNARIGGVALASYVGITSLLNKRPLERLIITDRSLLPKKTDVAVLPKAPSGDPALPLDSIPEEPAKDGVLAAFLCEKLADYIGADKVPMADVILACDSDSLRTAVELLAARIPDLAGYSLDQITAEYHAWLAEGSDSSKSHVSESAGADAVMTDASVALPPPPSGRVEAPAPLPSPAGEHDLALPSQRWRMNLTHKPVPSGAQAPAVITARSPAVHSHAAEASAFFDSLGDNVPINFPSPLRPDSPASSEGPPLDPDWARNLPTRPDTVADVEAALAANLQQAPADFGSFAPPMAPSRPTTALDLQLAVAALHSAETTRGHGDAQLVSITGGSSPLTHWSPPQPAPLSLEIPAPPSQPSLMPLPASPAAGPMDSLIPPPHPAIADSITRLVTEHSSVPEDFLLTVLERHSGDSASAHEWLASVADPVTLGLELAKAFPGAPGTDISASIRQSSGIASTAWMLLSATHKPIWVPRITGSQEVTRATRSTAPVVPESAPLEELAVVHPEHKLFVSQWWDKFAESKEHRVPLSSPHIMEFYYLCNVGIGQLPCSPRFIDYIQDLGKRASDTDAFKEAVSVFRSLPSYKTLRHCVQGHEDAAAEILPILVAEGVASPAAALWVALVLPPVHDQAFLSYPGAYRQVRRDRDAALLAAFPNLSAAPVTPGTPAHDPRATLRAGRKAASDRASYDKDDASRNKATKSRSILRNASDVIMEAAAAAAQTPRPLQHDPKKKRSKSGIRDDRRDKAIARAQGNRSSPPV